MKSETERRRIHTGRMCEICLKYKCPNGCPNNYTPRGKKQIKDDPFRIRGFSLVKEIGEKGVKPAVESPEKELK